MRKILTLSIMVLLVAGLLVAPASAKKKLPKPINTTFYMHGDAPVGDFLEFANYAQMTTGMVMDTNKPTSPTPSSMSFYQAVGNDQCTGNPLFPSWEAKNVSGRIVGDVTWDAHFLSAPATATARIWVDQAFSSCTSSAAGTNDYVDPLQSVDVSIPAGHNEVKIVFKKLNVPVTTNIVVELLSTSPSNEGRILYDSSDLATSLTVPCVPAPGASSCAGG